MYNQAVLLDVIALDQTESRPCDFISLICLDPMIQNHIIIKSQFHMYIKIKGTCREVEVEINYL